MRSHPLFSCNLPHAAPALFPSRKRCTQLALPADVLQTKSVQADDIEAIANRAIHPESYSTPLPTFR